jgi:hypothetical protein
VSESGSPASAPASVAGFDVEQALATASAASSSFRAGEEVGMCPQGKRFSPERSELTVVNTAWSRLRYGRGPKECFDAEAR